MGSFTEKKLPFFGKISLETSLQTNAKIIKNSREETVDNRELKHATFLSHGRQPEVRRFRI